MASIKKTIKYIFSSLYLRLVDFDYILSWHDNIMQGRLLGQTTFGKNVQMRRTARLLNPTGDKSKIVLHDNVIVDGELHVFNYGGYIEIGEYSYIGMGSRIWSGEKVIIGKYVLISHNVGVSDTSAHELDYLERAERYKDLLENGYPKTKASIKTAPIIIEDHAWINFDAIIMRGVRIGKGAIVAAGSVVTKDVPDFTLVAGNPAVVKKKLNDE